MREFLQSSLQKARSALTKQLSYPPAWPLHDEQCAKPDMHAQTASLLFGKLSAELRISIYESVLTDPERFLHICQNHRKRNTRHSERAVAHHWCTDRDSPFPTWQHACFGEHTYNNAQMKVFASRPITTTNDQLLSLLLSCRRMYVSSALHTDVMTLIIR
jgi:hypothetical protein